MVGEKLGSFRIEGTLGVGAMGVVYKATNETTGRPAAVKVVNADVAQRGKTYERFRREAEILQQFRHANIVRFYALGRYQGTSYFAMEYVPGVTLEQVLRARGALPWREVADLAVQITDALHYAHEHGVVHRDLKPSNLMVTEEGRVKLTDFGIAKDLDATALTATGRTLGTAAYMAPEQIRGTPEISHKTDLYALGVVLYQMLTGEAPFEGSSAVVLMHSHLNGAIPRPSSKVHEIPKGLDNLVFQLMAKDPTDRPWDAAAVSLTLSNLREKAERGESLAMVWPAEAAADPAASTRAAWEVVRRKKAPKAGAGWGPGSGRKLAETLGLVAALLGIAGFVGYMLMPLSQRALYDNAARLMASDDRHDWHKARDEFLDPLDRKYPANPYKGSTRAWRDKILLGDVEGRAKMLQSPVVTPLNEPQTKNEQRFVEYYTVVSAARKRGDDPAALAAWQDFAKPLEPNDPEDRRWALLAQKRAEDVRKTIEQRHERVINLLERARNAAEAGRADEAEAIRKELVERYGEYKELRGLLGPTPPGEPVPALKPSPDAPSDPP